MFKPLLCSSLESWKEEKNAQSNNPVEIHYSELGPRSATEADTSFSVAEK